MTDLQYVAHKDNNQLTLIKICYVKWQQSSYSN
ncbi:hypothetical protein WLH_04828 [Escherichia coli O25b:H4]|uniref:Uncharacterized protein n=1 Tax=Escherichia coli O25b:H4 TaxID=941280 RepID=A0A192CKR1_ECO25|nr:hypothetical protein WLH_04828 [Escherichia coli O25b:H4]